LFIQQRETETNEIISATTARADAGFHNL